MPVTIDNGNPPDTRIVVYDGICNLCNASVRFIIKRDPNGRYRFAHLQSQAGRRLAKQHGINPDSMTTFILVEQHRALTKSDAWLTVLDSLGGAWRLTRILRLVPRPLRDAVYDLVGRFRYRIFGTSKYCQIPVPERRDRFMDR